MAEKTHEQLYVDAITWIAQHDDVEVVDEDDGETPTPIAQLVADVFGKPAKQVIDDVWKLID